MLGTLTTIPGVKHVTEAIVRSTLFAHFVGGDTAEDTIPLLIQLTEDNKGILLACSVEVDDHEADKRTEKQTSHYTPEFAVSKRNVEVTLEYIDVAADFEDRNGTSAASSRKTWVAIKLDCSAFIMQATLSPTSRPRPRFCSQHNSISAQL